MNVQRTIVNVIVEGKNVMRNVIVQNARMYMIVRSKKRVNLRYMNHIKQQKKKN